LNKTTLKALFDDMTSTEKVAQTIQVNGDLVGEGSLKTGPQVDLGFSRGFDFNTAGSVFNVTKPDQLRALQKKAIKESPHHIPYLFMADVIYGFRTIFPIPLAQAGSFDFDKLKKAAQVTARESYNNGIHCLFSPMLDLSRDPRWGRVLESPGEDVYTARAYAKSIVQGYQGDDGDVSMPGRVAACIKHFASYGAPEGGREYNTVDMSTQRLFNEYLQPYQAAIDANCQLVMTAFNALNGTPATGNRWLNRDVLRGRFGFSGPLISDYSAISELQSHGMTTSVEESAKTALIAGVDMDMMTSVYANALPQLIRHPEFAKLLDEAVWRLLVLKNKLGLFEDPYRGLTTAQTGEVLRPEDRELATRLVEESVVLLKNEDVLPLRKDKKVALIGPYADSKLTLGFWASVTGNPMDTVTLREGLKQSYSDKQLTVAQGFNLFESYDNLGVYQHILEKVNGPLQDEQQLVQLALTAARESDVIVLTLGEQFMESGEAASKAHLTLPMRERRLLKALADLHKPIVGVLYTGRPLVLTDVVPYLNALLVAWYPGTMGGVGIANVLTGIVSPSARLSMSFPRSEGQIPVYYAQNTTGRPMDQNNQSERFISRYIDEANQPLFGFGAGLSYASSVAHWQTPLTTTNGVALPYAVTNNSDRSTAVVVHIYVHQPASPVVPPEKRLVDSKFLVLGARETVKTQAIINQSDLAFFDNEGVSHFQSGNYEFILDVQGQEEKTNIELRGGFKQ
jgi:beta-glucosidase